MKTVTIILSTFLVTSIIFMSLYLILSSKDKVDESSIITVINDKKLYRCILIYDLRKVKK
jgi:hypothetical protein